MKILMLAAKLDPSGASPYLTDELCEALLAMGHQVDVLFLDWEGTYQGSRVLERDGSRIHAIAPVWRGKGIARRMVQWALSSLKVLNCYRTNYATTPHDLLISFSPSIVFWAVLLWLKPRIASRMLIQWDFFPFHQAQIGLIPFRWMVSLGAKVETALLNTFTHIGCMSSRNVAYLRAHYELAPETRISVVPIWAKIRPRPLIDPTAARQRLGLPSDRFIAVFGGQITAGRGIEDIVDMARLARDQRDPIVFLVIGSGPKASWLTAQATELIGHLLVRPAVPRGDYLDLIAACDAGLVITVRNVDVPSFPSKTLDYCCAGIPVAAAVENTTDYGEFIADAGFGRYCEAGDIEGLLSILRELNAKPELRAAMGLSARAHYEAYFNVESVAKSIIETVQNA